MMCKFILICFVFFEFFCFSYEACLHDFKDFSGGIPSECSDCSDIFATPTNHICSISYLLFTEDNIDSPCYVEPANQDFDRCEFDPSKKTKILIHGFKVELKPRNIFEEIKNTLLTIENANVIIVNWTKFDGRDDVEYPLAFENEYLVGIEVGKFVNFLVNEKGVKSTDVHIIGHSLGAHVAGVAGKQVSGLGRISGLDPAAPLYNLLVTYNRLTDSDAYFVDVIHCSNGVIAFGSEGFGFPYPIGDNNFYPNGGVYQPACKLGRNYTNTDGIILPIKSNRDLIFCRHDKCLQYFLYSLRDCEFLSRECSSYNRYKKGECFSKSHPEDLMGFYAVKISGLPSHSKFYLNTTGYPPYCLKNCD